MPPLPTSPALYGEYVGIFGLRTMEMTEGDLPKKARELIKEWLSKHQDDLLEMWESQKLRKLPHYKRLFLVEGGEMIPRIKSIKPQKNYILHVIFDDGKDCLYNVKEDIDNAEQYKDLETIHGLFEQVQLDESRTCVFWSDYIDLASDTIYEYGKEVK